jgi:hypothetical protein
MTDKDDEIQSQQIDDAEEEDSQEEGWDDEDDVDALRERAVSTIDLVHAAYYWDGVDIYAYDLGDGRYFIYGTNDYDDIYNEIIPAEEAPQRFIEVQREFIQEYFGSCTIPHSWFSARDRHEPWFLHEMTTAVMSGGCEMVLQERSRYDGSRANRAALLWHRAVEQKRKVDGEEVPLGLPSGDDQDEAIEDGDDEAFARRFDRAELVWRDTLAPVSREEASTLRVVCQYLATR